MPTNPTKANTIETLIKRLKPGQAVHLGHSSVIANIGGVRVGLDLSTVDGFIPSPFSNLTLGSRRVNRELLPYLDQQTMIGRPEVIAKYLDLLLYSHLHPDHFSLGFISKAKAANPKLRVVVPPNTKQYLLQQTSRQRENMITWLLKKPLVDKLLRDHDEAVEEFVAEIKTNPPARKTLISSLEEAAPGRAVKIKAGRAVAELSSFFVTHPAFQTYVHLPVESDLAPLAVGFAIKYSDLGSLRTAMLVGECANDPAVLARIFAARDELTVLFFPTTEQTSPNGGKLLEELVSHASARTMAVIERITKPGTKIVPLHQGLWYFQLSSADILAARESIFKFRNKRSSLPFVALSRTMQAVAQESEPPTGYLSDIVKGSLRRWRQFKKIAGVAKMMPIGGEIVGYPPGRLIVFSIGQEGKSENQIPKDALIEAIRIHIAEHTNLTKEIESAWTWQKDLVNYSLITIGAVFTIVKAYRNLEILYIGASLALSALGLAYLEQSIRMLKVGRYFSGHLVPRVNALLLELAEKDVQSAEALKLRVLLWEKEFRAGDLKTALMGFAAMGKFSFAIFPGMIFALSFYLTKGGNPFQWPLPDLLLLGIATLVSLFPIVVAFINGRYAFTGRE